MDFKNMGAQRVCVVTDVNVAKLDAMKQVIEGLEREGIGYTVYDQTRVEPKDSSYASSLFLDVFPLPCRSSSMSPFSHAFPLACLVSSISLFSHSSSPSAFLHLTNPHPP